ncbi:hypothetical protein ACJIZ3_013458 [Penstemon smallii]|uniref:Uncharacterized protein n=1 Tax=Penstemon smallii TaxID=265156 RepID=A0ABD3URC8_9LAMI
MRTSYSSVLSLFSSIFFIILMSNLSVQVRAAVVSDCGAGENEDGCNDKKKALPLKIIAIVSILITSMIGVCLPLVTRSIPALSPDRSLFVIVKSFAAGIILATGFMHVLPDSFDMLSSSCLKENPWHKFPFSGFVAMLSAIVTLMIDSMATSLYSKKHTRSAGSQLLRVHEMAVVGGGGKIEEVEAAGSQLLRYRVIAMVLEVGIIVDSVVIGLSLGASNNICSIKGLVAALCFHQMAAMAFFFAVTTPFGIVLGLALARTYQENSPRALITVGLLNASSAGLLIYMALVDLLAADFMGPKLQSSINLQLKSFIAVLLGAAGMSLMAKWA